MNIQVRVVDQTFPLRGRLARFSKVDGMMLSREFEPLGWAAGARLIIAEGSIVNRARVRSLPPAGSPGLKNPMQGSLAAVTVA